MSKLLNHPQVKPLLSDEHFSVDGTLIEAWASQKSFRPKDGSGDAGGGTNFHGQQRKNDTHASTTDPDCHDAASEPTISVDLMAMLQSICDELTDRGFEVSFEARGRCPYCCRRVSTRRCFANLIENAVKYGQRAEVSLAVGASEIVIRIEDRGSGIPEQFREQVFRPFFRLDCSRGRNSGGSGLGLTVARSLARAHGGDVRLSAREGAELTVTVILPLNESAAPAAPPLQTAAE